MANPANAPRHDSRAFRPAPIGIGAWIAFGILLVLPAIALSRLAFSSEWRLLAGVPVIVSLLTFLAYRSDKKRAQTGEWRVSEATLHLMELTGGWPGALLAQRRYRHKTSKVSFQVAFWLLVLIHQAVSLDFLLDWRLSDGLLQLIKSQIA
ncbi:MAG TPA: DUF1294 domain-containing protein [Opitutaceae bacterium]|nr:DUF1294 domain-containing protein [Opitutaceae bacterium]